MTVREELKDIMQAVIKGGYKENQFEEFDADFGFRPWMFGHLRNPGAEDFNKAELREIHNLVVEGFNMAFDKKWREIYSL